MVAPGRKLLIPFVEGVLSTHNPSDRRCGMILIHPIAVDFFTQPRLPQADDVPAPVVRTLRKNLEYHLCLQNERG